MVFDCPTWRCHVAPRRRPSLAPLPPCSVNSEQATYRVAAIAATVGFFAVAAAAVHARFSWHRPDGDVPPVEAAATLLLALGGVVREGGGVDGGWVFADRAPYSDRFFFRSKNQRPPFFFPLH